MGIDPERAGSATNRLQTKTLVPPPLAIPETGAIPLDQSNRLGPGESHFEKFRQGVADPARRIRRRSAHRPTPAGHVQPPPAADTRRPEPPSDLRRISVNLVFVNEDVGTFGMASIKGVSRPGIAPAEPFAGRQNHRGPEESLSEAAHPAHSKLWSQVLDRPKKHHHLKGQADVPDQHDRAMVEPPWAEHSHKRRMKQQGPEHAQPTCRGMGQKCRHGELEDRHGKSRGIPRPLGPTRWVDRHWPQHGGQEIRAQLRAERGVDLREPRINIKADRGPSGQSKRLDPRKAGHEQGGHPELVGPRLKPILILEDGERQ